MTDLEIAVKNLEGHSICLCKDGEYFTLDGKGISPIMKLLGEGKDICGYSVADTVVGKAAAMLFVKAGIKDLHAKLMSKPSEAFLKKAHIPYTYETLAENIKDRTGTDICPMEKTVENIEDADIAYEALKNKLLSLKKGV